MHEKTNSSGRILGVLLGSGLGLKIRCPIGHIQVRNHDHLNGAQGGQFNYTTIRPTFRALCPSSVATGSCSWWGVVVVCFYGWEM